MFMLYTFTGLLSLNLIVALFVKIFFSVLQYTISLILFINMINCRITLFVYNLFSSKKKKTVLREIIIIHLIVNAASNESKLLNIFQHSQTTGA